MSNLHLGLRLEKILKCAGNCHVLCDIGCDHGKLGCYAVQHGIADMCISADISRNSLVKAEKLAESLGLSNSIVTVISDGFANIDVIPDITVISGMGGQSIIRILKKDEKKSRRTSFVLSPQSEIFELRMYLDSNGFDITGECCICESGKSYMIISCMYTGSAASHDKDDLYLGCKDVLECNSDYRSYIASLSDVCKAEIIKMRCGAASPELVFEKERYLDMLKGRLLWLTCSN